MILSPTIINKYHVKNRKLLEIEEIFKKHVSNYN